MSEVPFGIEPLIVQTQAVMDGGKPVPFTLWSAPEGGRVIGKSATGHMQDVEWIEEPGSAALWIQPDTPNDSDTA